MRLLKQLNKTTILKIASLLLFECLNVGAVSQLNPGIGDSFRPTTGEIIKFKILKITIKYEGEPGLGDEYYFDKSGLDTAVYYKGRLAWTKKWEKDNRGRIVKWTQYDSLRKPQYAANYIYEPEGSYVIKINDEKYKFRTHTQFHNTAGKIQWEFLMDGGQHIYKYDSIGRLSRIDSEPGVDGYDQYRAEYNYDSYGKLIFLKMDVYALGFEVVEKYYYDNKGLMTKSNQTVTYKYDNEKDFYTTIYSYVFSEK